VSYSMLQQKAKKEGWEGFHHLPLKPVPYIFPSLPPLDLKPSISPLFWAPFSGPREGKRWVDLRSKVVAAASSLLPLPPRGLHRPLWWL
jgi:hypothetical protein